jgi:hypothetical protein
MRDRCASLLGNDSYVITLSKVLSSTGRRFPDPLITAVEDTE